MVVGTFESTQDMQAAATLSPELLRRGDAASEGGNSEECVLGEGLGGELLGSQLFFITPCRISI